MDDVLRAGEIAMAGFMQGAGYIAPTLIIKDCDGLIGGIDLGWRVTTSDGGHHDIIWGNTRDDASLRRLVQDPEWKQHMPERVIDERVKTAGAMPLELPAWWNTPGGVAAHALGL